MARAPGGRRRLGQRWAYELTPDGADATVVTEIDDCSRVAAPDLADIDSMAETLERLDRICTGG